MTRRFEIDDDGRILLDGHWIARVVIGEPDRDGRPNVRFGAVRAFHDLERAVLEPGYADRQRAAEAVRLTFTSWQVSLDEWEAASPAAHAPPS